MKWNPCEYQETSDKKECPVVLLNILSTFTMYAGNTRGLDVEVNTVQDKRHWLNKISLLSFEKEIESM